jgi:hypothetical protein
MLLHSDDHRSLKNEAASQSPFLFGNRKKGSRHTTFHFSRIHWRHCYFIMQNDKGEVVDLYIPRKW